MNYERDLWDETSSRMQKGFHIALQLLYSEKKVTQEEKDIFEKSGKYLSFLNSEKLFQKKIRFSYMKNATKNKISTLILIF